MVVLAYCGVAGFALNGLGLPVFGGTEIVFGGCLTLLTTYRYGPWWGALATGTAFSSTWLAWGHPWGLLCFVMEAVVVGWLLKHRQEWRPLAAACLYWALVGIPLAVLAVGLLIEVPFPSNWAIVVKYPVNSLLMAMLALPVFHSRWFRQFTGMSPDRDAATPLKTVLSRRFGIIIALAIATLSLVAGRIFDKTLREISQEELVADSNELATQLEAYLDRHQRALALLTAEYSARPAGDEVLAADLELLRRHYPGFLTLLGADARGRIIAASPAVNPDGVKMAHNGFSVQDRDYFRNVMNTGRPYVSEVFQGRGFGAALIVALSAAVKDAADQPVMVVEGSLDVSQLPRAIRLGGLLDGRNLLILDQTRRVVADTGSTAAPTLGPARGLVIYDEAKSAAAGTAFLFEARNGGRLERFVGARASVARYGWELYLSEPLWHSQELIARYYLLTTLWAVAMIGLGMVFARDTAREITRPLNELASAIRQLARQSTVAPVAEVPHASLELTEISRELRGATLTLSQSNQQLAQAVTERDKSHRELQDMMFHLEEKVRERTEQLEVARVAAEAANTAKSEFLASMSHELRTPLNVILGMSELLTDSRIGPLNERQLEGMLSVNESGRHLLALINDILDLSKIEAGMLFLDMQPTDLAGVCATSLRFVREAALKKNIPLESVLRNTEQTVVLDERRVKQILVNLLVNAVKFTPAGGRVGLEVSQQENPPGLRFVVWDTGIGIAPEHRGRLFQPFRQIDSSLARKYSGTGLGLALVKRMTQLHGGTVDLESEPGRGSRFGITLPLRLPENATPGPDTPQEGTSSRSPMVSRSLRILIAEDNETNHRVYANYFHSRSDHLVLARDGREAVEKAFAEPPDLILMDMQMPVMDGFEATRRLRADARTEWVPIIAITAMAMPEDRERCFAAGAEFYLSKPVNLRELTHLLDQISRRPPAPSFEITVS